MCTPLGSSPTGAPTEGPTDAPTGEPTAAPTTTPTEPTDGPTAAPTEAPIELPHMEGAGEANIECYNSTVFLNIPDDYQNSTGRWTMVLTYDGDGQPVDQTRPECNDKLGHWFQNYVPTDNVETFSSSDQPHNGACVWTSPDDATDLPFLGCGPSDSKEFCLKNNLQLCTEDTDGKV